MTNPSTPVLSIRGLRFRYPGAQTDTVSVSNLDLAAGEQLLLTAGSGKGKSTLLQLIAGLLDAGEGSIVLAGTDMVRLRGASRDTHRGRHLGMIFQTFNLLHGFTALENVLAALMFSEIPPREHRASALALLGRLGIDRPDATPEELSVGQQQRVAVARAVAARPALVLADEPTASLDPENAAGAMDLIQSACKDVGAALLCVSHDPSMAPRFARRVSLAELSLNAPAIGAAR
ncbi:MAG: ATP-binding cassette domain-containing protein [Planctomycetota bacterium]|nr:ATP-binding cassette domain-containing protein [Planctomycetota bacterium]